MTAVHLDVLRARTVVLEAPLPAGDTVGARVDGGGGNLEQWLAVLRAEHRLGRRRVPPLRQLVEERGVGLVAVVEQQTERRAQRDHLPHCLRMVPRRLAPEDPARAPADDADLPAGALGQLEQPLRAAVEDRRGRAQVLAQAPAVAGVPEHAQHRPQRARVRVGRTERWEHEDGMAVAAGLCEPERPRGQEQPELGPGPHLERQQREGRRPGHRIVVNRCHCDERTALHLVRCAPHDGRFRFAVPPPATAALHLRVMVDSASPSRHPATAALHLRVMVDSASPSRHPATAALHLRMMVELRGIS